MVAKRKVDTLQTVTSIIHIIKMIDRGLGQGQLHCNLKIKPLDIVTAYPSAYFSSSSLYWSQRTCLPGTIVL